MVPCHATRALRCARRCATALVHRSPHCSRAMSSTDEPGNATFHKFDAAAKADAFRRVFDAGKPMWEALAAELDREMAVPPTRILSVGDGPGEPGCYLAAKFGCPTICSDSVVPMVEAAKQRVAAKGLSNVECLLLDMQDLSAVEAASVDVVSSAHAYPFSPDKPKALAEAIRVLKPGGTFGAVVWVSFELLPFAGAIMAAVTGKQPVPPPPGAPPPPPLSLAEPSVSDALLTEAGFELREGVQDTVRFTMAPELALRYCALPVWDRLTEMENSGELPDAWAKYEAAWPEVAKAKGHLSDDGFSISGVYRVIVARKPVA